MQNLLSKVSLVRAGGFIKVGWDHMYRPPGRWPVRHKGEGMRMRDGLCILQLSSVIRHSARVQCADRSGSAAHGFRF